MRTDRKAAQPTSSLTSSSPDIGTLRVAQSELISGNTGGKVYIRLSEGSVAFLTPRDVAQSQVNAQLRQELLNETIEDDGR